MASAVRRACVAADPAFVVAGRALVAAVRPLAAADRALVAIDQAFVVAVRALAAADRALAAADRALVVTVRALAAAGQALAAADQTMVADLAQPFGLAWGAFLEHRHMFEVAAVVVAAVAAEAHLAHSFHRRELMVVLVADSKMAFERVVAAVVDPVAYTVVASVVSVVEVVADSVAVVADAVAASLASPVVVVVVAEDHCSWIAVADSKSAHHSDVVTLTVVLVENCCLH